MKKVLFTLSVFALLQTANAQAPAGFNYQGIARNSSGAPLASRPLALRITIHEGTATGTTVYQETQTATTNAYGLYNLTIGRGTPVTGTMAGVNWGAGDKYIQVELDPNGGTSYTDLGTSQLMSVPFAMAAASAPAPVLSITNDTLTAGGNSIKLPTYTAGTGIAISGGTISTALTGGTGISVSGATIGANNTAALWNASQLQGQAVSSTAPAAGQGLVWNGSAWTPTTPASYTGGTGITVSGSNVISVNSLTGDVTGAPNATVVGKIQGTSVAATAPTSGQVLKYNGTAYAPAADLGVISTSGTNNIPKTTGSGTQGTSAIYDLNSRIGINTTTPQLDLDIVADSFGIRNSSAWDNLWLHVDGDMASINANGAGDGLIFRVGNNGGTFGGGATYNSTAGTLDTVMTLMPSGKVGVGTMQPHSTLQVQGSMSLPIYTATANYTATDKDYTILCRSALTPYTITLPSASGLAGRIYVVRRAPLLATNTISVITVTSASGINGAGGAVTSISMSGNNAITLQSDGSSWYVISMM